MTVLQITAFLHGLTETAGKEQKNGCDGRVVKAMVLSTIAAIRVVSKALM